MNRQGHAASASRGERTLAAVLAALPLLYLVTERSWNPVVWHYSVPLLSAIALYTVLYAAFLMSYRWRLPAWLIRVRTSAVTTVFGVVIALTFVEAVLEIIDERPDVTTSRLRGYEPDPDTGYVYRPNYEQEVVTLESATHWRSNSLGIRANREYGPKPAGVVRVLALGDSFTIDTQAELSDTWPGVLEHRLSEALQRPNSVEVVNGGHAGYGTMEQLNWYRKYALGLEADIVVVALTPNDITDNAHDPPGAFTAVDGYMATAGSTRSDLERFRHRERWYSLPGQLERSHVWQTISNGSFTRHEGPKLAACHEQLTPEEERLHQRTEQYLLQIRDLAASQGASFGLLLLTFQEQLGAMAPGYSGAVFGQRWRRFAEERGIQAVNTYDQFREHSGAPLYWRWDAHFTKEGNRLAGEAASDLVSRMLELRRATAY